MKSTTYWARLVDDLRNRLANLSSEQEAQLLARLPPLSAGQRQLWYLHRLYPDDSSYNMCRTLRIDDNVDTVALDEAVRELTKRHQVLRYVFFERNEQPHAWIAPPHDGQILSVESAESKREAMSSILALCDKPFRLEQDTPFRIVLQQFEARSSLLAIVVHHICCDDRSLDIIVSDLKALYSAFAQGLSNPLPEQTLQYADFARWQLRRQQTNAFSADVTYWMNRLSPVPPGLELPFDTQPGPHRSGKGGYATLTLGSEIAEQAAVFHRRRKVTPFVLFLTVFKILLHRYTGQTDLAIGTPVTLRSRTEFDTLVGFFVNTLVMRTSLGGDPTFLEFLERVRDTVTDALSHQELPFESVVERLRSSQRMSTTPFRIMFLMEEDPFRIADGRPEVRVRARREPTLPNHSKFDLTLQVRLTKSQLRFRINYTTDLFEPATIDRMLEHLDVLLRGVIYSPHRRISKLPLLTTKERTRALVDWNDTTRLLEALPWLHERVERRAVESPLSLAAVAGDRQLSYAELMNWVYRVQSELTDTVVPGSIVPIAMAADVSVPVALLAVLRCGAAYAPLDLRWPRARLEQILDRLNAGPVLTDREGAERLAEHPVRVLPDPPTESIAAVAPRPVEPEMPAYVMTTSGSTGQPKCCVIPHRAVHNRIAWMDRFYGSAAGKVVLQTTPHAYDSSVWQLLWPLALGGTTVIPVGNQALDGDEVARLIGTYEVTMTDFVPSVLQHLASRLTAGRNRSRLASLRVAIVGGEEIVPEAVDQLRQVVPGLRAINAYGPTEATIGCLAHEILDGERDRIPIGRPNDNVYALVLDRHGNLVPAGVAGELCIGGLGLALGYFGDADETRARFVDNPFPEVESEKLYRTGDLVRWRADGEIEFLGRLDQQVQLRGVRVEPSEIESALRRHPQIASCAVISSRTQVTDERELVAFYTAREPCLTVDDLRAVLRSRLPIQYMPARFVRLKELPITENGKLDRRRLLEHAAITEESRGEPRAPSSAWESRLQAIWREVLQRPDLSVEDDFFALGGHSLLAVRLVSRIRDAFAREVPLASIFEYPTVRQLATVLEQIPAQTVAASTKTVHDDTSGDKTFGLSEQQKPLWQVFELFPDKPFANLRVSMRLRGRLDIDALSRALGQLMSRHELLRVRLEQDRGSAHHVVCEDVSPPLALVDLSEAGNTAKAVEEYIREELTRPLDLRTAPPFRVVAFRLNHDCHELLYRFHHALADGWSVNLFAAELTAYYRAQRDSVPIALAPPERQFSDYVGFEQAWLESEGARGDLDYWKSQLGDAVPVELPADHDAGGTSFRLVRLQTSIPEELSSALQRIAQQESSTLFMVLAAVLFVWIHRKSGQSDMQIGTVVANRGRAEFEKTMGLFANTLLIRCRIGQRTSFRDLIRQTRRITLAALEHQMTPFNWISSKIGLAHTCQIMLVHEQESEDLALAHTEVETRPLRRRPVIQTNASRTDLLFVTSLTADGIQVRVEYSPDRFNEETVQRWLGDLGTVVSELIAAPAAGV